MKSKSKPEAKSSAADPAPREQVAKWSQLTVRIPPDVHRALRIRSVEEGRSAAIIVEGLIREYLVYGAPKGHSHD